MAFESTGVELHRWHQVMRSKEPLHWAGILTWRNLSRCFAISVASLQSVVLFGGSRQSKVRIRTSVSHNNQKNFVRGYLIRPGFIARPLHTCSDFQIFRRIVHDADLNTKAYLKNIRETLCLPLGQGR